MNILYIDHYAGSLEMGMEFRPYYLSKRLLQHSHKVDIIAADYSHTRTRNPNIENGDSEVIDGITYHYIHTTKYRGNGAKRILSMFQFVNALKRKAKKIAKSIQPDVIITSSTYPLDTYGGQKIKKITQNLFNKKVVLIHEVHDMWPITPMELLGLSKRNPFIVLLQKAENSFCKHSDKIISILPCAKEYFVEHGMDEKKFYFVPNGINLSDWNEKKSVPTFLKERLTEERKNGRFILCFFGSHTKSYALNFLLEAIRDLASNKLFVVFVGDGNYKEELMKMSKEYNIDNSVFFADKIDKKSIPDLMSFCDALYIGALKNRMFQFGIGMNKLFDSMMSGKPILYAVSAPNNYIEEFKCGITVDAENTAALVEGLKKLLAMDEKELYQMGKNGKEAVLKFFNYDAIGERLNEIIIGDERE